LPDRYSGPYELAPWSAAVFPALALCRARRAARAHRSIMLISWLVARRPRAEEGASRLRLGVTIYSSIGIIATCGGGKVPVARRGGPPPAA
jgi:hypothetical protein